MQEEKRQTVLIVEDDWELADGIAWMLEKKDLCRLRLILSGRQKNGIRKRVRTWCYWT